MLACVCEIAYPQASGHTQRLGAHFGRALGSGDATASEYIARVSGGFLQAGKNVALSRALLLVGTHSGGGCDARPAPITPDGQEGKRP
jgi:hypothetical protein